MLARQQKVWRRHPPTSVLLEAYISFKPPKEDMPEHLKGEMKDFGIMFGVKLPEDLGEKKRLTIEEQSDPVRLAKIFKDAGFQPPE